jgi:hypothetical protein
MVQHGDIDHTGLTGVGGAGTAELLGLTAYEHGSDTNFTSTTSTTIVDAHASLTVVFTAPASGNVLVRLSCMLEKSGTSGIVRWGLRESTTTLGEAVMVQTAATLTFMRLSAEFYLTGVTGGAHTYKWAFRTSAGTTYLSGGPTYGKAIMEVWAAP